MPTVTITDNKNATTATINTSTTTATVNVTSDAAKVVTVKTQGPQGPKGDDAAGSDGAQGPPGIITSHSNLIVTGSIWASGSTNGHVTASGNISSSGTITAEHLYSSDDAHIEDDLKVDGDITGSSIKLQGSPDNKIRYRTVFGTEYDIIHAKYSQIAGRVVIGDAAAGNYILTVTASDGIILDSGAGLVMRSHASNVSLGAQVDTAANSYQLILRGDRIELNGNITASGTLKAASDISSSGNIYAVDYFDNGTNINTLYDLTPALVISSSANGDITASGNISTEKLFVDKIVGKTDRDQTHFAQTAITASGLRITSTSIAVNGTRVEGGTNNPKFHVPMDGTTTQMYGMNLYIKGPEDSRIQLADPQGGDGHFYIENDGEAANWYDRHVYFKFRNDIAFMTHHEGSYGVRMSLSSGSLDFLRNHIYGVTQIHRGLEVKGSDNSILSSPGFLTVEGKSTLEGPLSGSSALFGSDGQVSMSQGNLQASNNIIVGNKLYFNTTDDTYIDSDSTDRIRFIAGGQQMFVLDYDTGNRAVFGDTKVGIGSGLGDNFLPTADLHVGGNVWVSASNGHITASGNISSSGTIYANEIELSSHLYIPDSIVHAQDTNTKMRFPEDDTISFHTSGNEQLRIDANGNITASGNISASGTITAASFAGSATGLTGTPDITVGSITATSINTINITSSIITASVIETSGSNIFGDTITDTHTFNGHITASGNISASGDIFANSIKLSEGNGITFADEIEGPSVTIDSAGQVRIDSAGSTINFSKNSADKYVIRTSTNSHDFTGAITASGGITASGLLHISASVKPGETYNVLVRDPNSGLIYETGSYGVGGSGGSGTITALNNQTENRLVSIGSTTTQLDGEANLTFDGTTLNLAGTITASGDIVATGSFFGDRRFDVSLDADFARGRGDIVYFGGGTTEAGHLFYYNSSGNWVKTDADAESSSTGLLAIALGTSAPEHGMMLRGMYTLDHSVSNIGAPVYVDTNPTGEMTTTAPNNTNDVVRIVGYVIDATNNKIWFNPDTTWVTI